MISAKCGLSQSRYFLAVAALLLLPVLQLYAQQSAPASTNAPAKSDQPVKTDQKNGKGKAVPASPAVHSAFASPSAQTGQGAAAVHVDRAQAYYHLALADINEDEATTTGRREYVTKAVEEYKLALNADPESEELTNALALFYFRAGRITEAIATAKDAGKRFPNSLEAHRLLGKIYLRSLSDGQEGSGGNTDVVSPAGEKTLDLAVAEFKAILVLDPKSVEDRMILGQLYTAKHEKEKAENEFRIAQSQEPESEEVVLNLARLYAESDDVKHEAAVIAAVPVADRTARMEFALGAAEEELKQPKEAIAAYQRAVGLDPDNLDMLRALAQALLSDDQLPEAQKRFEEVAEADPDDASALVKIAEAERRQGKYEAALETVRKARKKDGTSLEAGYNEGLLLDVLGRTDEAAAVYEEMVDQTSHANGAYTAEERNNRGIFLERLGSVYHEQNKVQKSIDAYQRLIDMGGDSVVSGYRAQVEVYTDAKQFDKAVEVAQKAVVADQKDRELKLALSDALISAGKTEEAISEALAGLDNTDEDRTIWLGLAQIYTRLHRWKDAEQSLEKAEMLTRKKDDQVSLNFYRGVLAERQKHYESAEQFFTKVLELDPTNVATLNYMGYMLADKGTKLPDALKMIRKAVELEPMNGAYLDSLGWAYFKLGEYELAEANLRSAVERDQTDATVHDHLGDLYEKTGRIRLAAAQWEISLTEFARSAKADVDPADVTRVQHKLEGVRIRQAKQEGIADNQKAHN